MNLKISDMLVFWNSPSFGYLAAYFYVKSFVGYFLMIWFYVSLYS